MWDMAHREDMRDKRYVLDAEAESGISFTYAKSQDDINLFLFMERCCHEFKRVHHFLLL
jgi:homogentisate 1,2-dioxygenase